MLLAILKTVGTTPKSVNVDRTAPAFRTLLRVLSVSVVVHSAPLDCVVQKKLESLSTQRNSKLNCTSIGCT